jgi:hypothetical protein
VIDKIRILSFTFIILVFFTGNSCKKENMANGTGAVIPGTISLEVHAIHHSWDVSNIMFYLKKNATDFPGHDSSIYEFKGQADGYGKYTFEKLYPGSYYLYASGYDAIWGDNVHGYIPVVLDQDHVVDNSFNITLEVSE